MRSIIGDGCASGLPAISGDGTTIVGCNVNSDGKWNAAKWLGGTSWLDLGTVEGGVPCDIFLSGSWGVNQDGSLAVGLVWLPQLCRASAGTWDLINGGPATALPRLFEDPATRANAVNADGSVIVGWQDQPTGERTAAKWVNGVEELILTPSGGFNGEAQAVSADGKRDRGRWATTSVTKRWIWRPKTGRSADRDRQWHKGDIVSRWMSATMARSWLGSSGRRGQDSVPSFGGAGKGRLFLDTFITRPRCGDTRWLDSQRRIDHLRGRQHDLRLGHQPGRSCRDV